jgi:hypothetical protein
MLKNEYNREDKCSFSNPEEAISTVLHLEWTLDFEAKQVCFLLSFQMATLKSMVSFTAQPHTVLL